MDPRATSGVPLIYDAHELWTENVQFDGGAWVPMSKRTRFVARLWERILLRRVDLLVTVGPSLGAEFGRRKGSAGRPLVVPNFPSLELLQTRAPTESIRKQCGLTASQFVTLYMGGVGPLRNIESVIEARKRLPTTTSSS